MKNCRERKLCLFFGYLLFVLMFNGCIKKQYKKLNHDNLLKIPSADEENLTNKKAYSQGSLFRKTDNKTLDFKVENKTGKRIYIACFTYMRRNVNTKWRWSKTPVYKLENKETVFVNIPEIKDRSDRKNTFGYLGVFKNEKHAEDSIYELMKDDNKIDLDKLIQLRGKTVVIQAEKYGFKEEFLDYDFVDYGVKKKKIEELDFLVVNNTGKTLFVCGFIYMKKAKGTWAAAEGGEKDDMSTWRFDKTKVLKVKHGQTVFIDVDTITTKRDKEFVIGFLGVFNKNEKRAAYDSTFELLRPRNKISLGNLSRKKNKKIVLDIERYGIRGDIINFTIKPVCQIDWKNALR